MIGLKKEEEEINVEKKKKTHVHKSGFGFWVEISTNYFFILYMADKASLFFGEKSKLQPMSSSLGNDTFFWVCYI